MRLLNAQRQGIDKTEWNWLWATAISTANFLTLCTHAQVFSTLQSLEQELVEGLLWFLCPPVWMQVCRSIFRPGRVEALPNNGAYNWAAPSNTRLWFLGYIYYYPCKVKFVFKNIIALLFRWGRSLLKTQESLASWARDRKIVKTL